MENLEQFTDKEEGPALAVAGPRLQADHWFKVFCYFCSLMVFLVISILAYLLGSIPSAVWLGRAFRGIDLREHGSGNAGATNAFRVLGSPIGVLVLLMDAGKAVLAVMLAGFQPVFERGSEAFILLQIGLGLLAVVGHIFPVFAGFRGGKGVAALLGAGLAIYPFSALCAMAVYVFTFLLSRYSALGSLLAASSYPLWMMLVFKTDSLALRVFSLLVPLLVFYTHRSNISRLLKGEEKRVFGSKIK